MSSAPDGRASGVSGFSGGGFRLEIQALRAIAVLVVLVFHIWPDTLPGGYVGVDVFFVISGYLITGILYKQFSTSGRIDVADFYVRRIRRLLPAAAVVLLAVAFLIPLLPQTRWEDNAAGIVASALYVQNWWLAAQAVDYLAAESAPTAVMHFWSLSVEEQYYIAWPLLLLLLTLLPASLKREPGRMFLGLVLVVVVLSLGYSVWLTSSNPGVAYFSTFTRAWELGVGGLLAVTTRWRSIPQVVRDLLGWVGLAMIAAAVLLFDKTTPFPGYTAALPVLGAALIIIARDSVHKWSAYGVLRSRPFQYVGDISYSLYLWHWPVIVFYIAAAGRTPGLVDGIALAMVSCALAHQTKVLVEDRYRSGAADGHSARRAFGLAAVSIVACLLAAWAAPRPWASLDGDRPGAGATQADVREQSNPGAAALTEGVPVGAADIFPSPERARNDFAAPYREGCMTRGSRAELGICTYGNPDGAVHAVLLGDTHAAQWQPALAEVADRSGWRLSVIAKTECALGDAPPLTSSGEAFPSCVTWRRRAMEKVAELKPDILLVAQSAATRIERRDPGASRNVELAASLAAMAEEASRHAGKVVFIRSPPRLREKCRDPEEAASCSSPRSEALAENDPVLLAARRVRGADLLDLTDGICEVDRCSAVVGNVPVYRARAHLTATYSRSMAPFFARELSRVFEGESPLLDPVDTGVVDGTLARLAVAAQEDNPDSYGQGCHVGQASSEPLSCIYGDADSPVRIVLVGDSHAGHWLPALQEVVQRNGWALHSYTKSACSFSDAVVKARGREYESCTEWNRRLMDRLEDMKPLVVVMSQSRAHSALAASSREENQEILAQGLVDRWAHLRRLGIGVVAIADTPWMARDVPDCLSTRGARAEDCETPRDVALRMPDAMLRAVDAGVDVQFVDMTEHMCNSAVCPPIIGGVVVWRDRHHLTATFSRALASHLEPAVKRAIATTEPLEEE